MINFVLKLSFFRNQAHKLGILLLCTIISIMIAILVTVPQTTGYELSIYDAYPIYFWVLLMCSITCGIIILVQQAFSEKRSRLWAVGFFVIIFTNLIILLLPVIRGYVVLGRGDVLTHIGYIKEILYTAHFSSNFYPAIHILTATLSSMTGLTPELLAELVPVTFTVFYMISVYIFARAFSSHRGQVLLIAAFGCLLLFRHENIMLAPSVQCFYMLPFVLFLFLKAQTSTKRQCHFLTLIVSLSAIPFLHPGEGTIFLILTFLSFSLAIWFHRWNNHLKQIDLFSSLKHLPIFYTCLVLFTIWFIWFSYTSTFSEAIAYVWNQLLYPTNETTAMEYFTILDNGNLSIFKTIRIFLNMVGQVAIYCLVGSVVIIYLLKKFIFDRIKISFQQFNFAVLFIIFSVLLFIAFFSNIIWVDYGREMRYVIFAATILDGLGVYSLFRKKYRRIGTIFVAVVLITAATFGIFNTFPSPIIRDSNSQITNMEITGMTWFLIYQDDHLLIENIYVNQLRFADLVLGHKATPQNIRYDASPPDHFGYHEYSLYGESFTADRYFIDSKISRIINPSVFPEYSSSWKFTPADFYQLDYVDPSVSRVFSNGEFWVYYIQERRNTL